MDESAPLYLVQDTDTVEKQFRFESWHRALSGTFEVPEPDQSVLSKFHVRADVWHLGTFLASTTAFNGAFGGERTAKMARADQVDHYRLMLQVEGSLRVDADGQRRIAAPGEIILTDMAQEQTYERDSGSCIFLFIPRELLEESLPGPANLHACTPRGVGAALLADHLRSLMRQMPQMTQAEMVHVARSTLAMVGVAFGAGPAALELAKPAFESTLLRQISKYVEIHLGDLELSPQSICRTFGISRATLYRLFEPAGGVAAFIRERRLLSVHDRIAAEDRRPMARLAEDYCFSSAAHFSRAFKEMFGYSPSEARDGRTTPSLPVDQPTKLVFRDWLRSLRG